MTVNPEWWRFGSLVAKVVVRMASSVGEAGDVIYFDNFFNLVRDLASISRPAVLPGHTSKQLHV